MSDNKKYLIRVKANHDCWISDIDGDPGRTTKRENAKIYYLKELAEFDLDVLRMSYPNREFTLENTI